MRVLTLWQPWATLIALGVKSIETRPSPAPRALIGERIAIHAAQRDVIPLGGLSLPPIEHAHRRDGETWDDARARADAHNRQTWLVIHTISDPAYRGPRAVNPRTGRTSRVPMRAQSITLFWPHAGPWYRPRGEFTHTEYLPLGAIVATARLTASVPMTEGPGCCSNDRAHLCIVNESMLLHSPLDAPWPDGETERVVSDQRPYGHFAPGRWAYVLEDVERLPDSIPFRGGQGWSRSWEPSC